MIPVGETAEFISIVNVTVAMVIAHTLYKTPKKWWQCVAAWVITFAVCIAIGEVLNVLLPQFTEQRLAAFTGCLLSVAYWYLFPNIPLPQRIFNYFLAMDFMYVILLIARTAAMLLVGYLALPPSGTFFVVYLLCTAGFLAVYQRWLKRAIRRGLAAFQTNLSSLTVFSIICYFASLFLVDAWAPWPPLRFYTALPVLALVAMNVGGYVLAFRTLTMMGQQITTQAETKMAQLQLTLAEKEYHTTMEGIDQVRRMRHDMSHHLTALLALVSNDDKKGAQEYIEKVTALLPQKPLTEENLITANFLERYSELGQQEGITFQTQVSYDEANVQNKAYLGILLGNALQNAYEAARQAEGAQRFISFEGRQVYNNLVMIVKNGYSGQRKPLLKSTKGQGHGIGLSSMRSVVEEYQGYMDATYDGAVFTLKIALPLRQ